MKSIIATITASRPGVDKVTILNDRLEDNKEYVVCSSLVKLIKNEEKYLEKKKKEEERKRKREEQQTPQPRCSLQTKGLQPEQFYLLADVVDNDKEEEEEQQQQ